MINKLLEKLQQLLKEKNFKEAEKVIDKINKRPQMPEVHLDVAKFCVDASFWKPVKKYFEKAVREKSELALQVTLWLDKEPLFSESDKALELLSIADTYKPNNILLISARGAVLNRKEKFEESIKIFEHVLQQQEDNSRQLHALMGLGEAYFKTNRYHDSIAAGTLALQMKPEHADANFQLGLCYIAIGNLTEGVKYLSKVLEIDPSHLGAHINLAHVMLKIGMFDQGWQHHEWRFDASMKNIANFNLPFPRWRNQDINGKHLFIWIDQGLGDQIMYGSMINRLIERGAKVSVMAERRLENIFLRSFSIENFFSFDRAGINEISKTSSHYDYHCPFGTLPAFFIRSFDDFGKGDAYIKPDPELVEKFSKDLKGRFGDKKLIGFGWRGGIAATRNHARLIDLSLWKDMFSRDDSQFINFQYDATDEEKELLSESGVYTPDIDLKHNIDVVISYMAALDLYITADNTNAHFAGAIGLPVWNLIPLAAEWRWFLERDYSYWYNSMRLFRNTELDSWDSCVQSVTRALSEIFSPAHNN